MTEPVDPALAARVERWRADDPDPVSREGLYSLLQAAQAGDRHAQDELSDAFAGPLSFGTAGLRGRLGAGPNRMNRVVVIRAAAALARYLLDAGNNRGHDPEPARPRGETLRVAVGFDARHGSAQFARDTAAVLVGAGLDVLLFPRPLPTPMLAWLTRHHPCHAGVMVTASHNPPQDNGYKVYLGGTDGGRPIVSPADTAIATRLAQVSRIADVPRADSGWSLVTDAELDGYLDAAASVLDLHRQDRRWPPTDPAPADPPKRPDATASPLRIVATALHGVGGAVLVEVLRRAGFSDVTLVASQATPDPDFPTVAFPNPEEPGALDAAITTAIEVGADLVLALDPDADRCAVAVADPHRLAARTGWRMLTGNELGCLLADFVAPTIAASGGGTLVCSIVSSTHLGAVAAAHGLEYVRTLTGFKWISRAPRLAFGYEEALGYCVAPDLVPDKDGITAAVLACHLAATRQAAGSSLPAALDELALRDGLFCTDQLSLRVDLAERDAVLDRIRAAPPCTLGGEPVTGLDDLADGVDGAPGTQGLRLRLPDGWVIVRPSGTEPKLKAYLEVRLDLPGNDVAAARVRGARRLERLRGDLAALLAARRLGGLSGQVIGITCPEST